MTQPRIRVLAAAFASVPGSSPHGAAMMSLVEGLRAELDLVTIKTEDLSHIKRIGDARMFRVPLGSAMRPESQRRDIYARAVARQIAAERYDVVHVMDPWAGVAAIEQRRESSFSLAYEICSIPEAVPGEACPWLEAHERTLAAADRIMVSTLAAAAVLKKRGFGGRLDVVRPGVDIAHFDWADVPRFRPPRLLYLGPFSPVRDLRTLLGAVERVASLRPVRVLLAGERDRQRREDVKAQVAAAGLTDIVDVRGEPGVLSMPGLIAAADLCLAPARDHRVAGFAELPQPMLEYMACFRPVVAAAVPGVQELVADEVEGLLYPPGEAPAMADAILEALRDGALRERITEAGYRRVRSELDAGARRRRIREVYDTLAPGSQSYDPWTESFEETAGLTGLNTSAMAFLQEEAADTIVPPPDAVTDPADTPEPILAEAKSTEAGPADALPTEESWMTTALTEKQMSLRPADTDPAERDD